MLFNSGIFLFYFLPLVLIGYQVLARFGRRAVIGWLALASVAFYSWWNWHFVYVLVGSMLMNFAISQGIWRSSNPGRKSFWLMTGVALNLGALCYYKYLFHILRFTNDLVGGHHNWHDVALPLGISFFTFTQIAYLVDLSQEQAQPQNIVEYALFVTFFPHLIAGPILHHKEMMPQFLEKNDPTLKMDDMLLGMSWFVLGFAKKCMLADTFAQRANDAFTIGNIHGVQGAWVGVIMYSLQLYFDFSGYSDMAIGLSRMFSIRFPMNFDSPYKAMNIIDFWARWHMTLTRYLTLYLYNPISLAVSRRRMRAGKKVSQKAARTVPGFLSMIATPTLTTMFLAGIWHGAGLQFLIFGVLHGIYLTINHGWRLYRGDKAERAPVTLLTRVGFTLLTYACVLVAQVFFRADSMHEALVYFAGMTGIHGSNWHDTMVDPNRLLVAAIGLFLVWAMPNTQQILRQVEAKTQTGHPRWWMWKPTWQWSVAVGVLFFISLLFSRSAAKFLYFQF